MYLGSRLGTLEISLCLSDLTQGSSSGGCSGWIDGWFWVSVLWAECWIRIGLILLTLSNLLDVSACLVLCSLRPWVFFHPPSPKRFSLFMSLWDELLEEAISGRLIQGSRRLIVYQFFSNIGHWIWQPVNSEEGCYKCKIIEGLIVKVTKLINFQNDMNFFKLLNINPIRYLMHLFIAHMSRRNYKL